MTQLVDLLFRVSTEQLDKAADKLKTVGAEAKNVNGEADNVGATFGRLAGPIAVALTGLVALAGAAAVVYNKLSEMRAAAIDAGDQMNDLANRTNVATERLSLLDAMSKMAGSSADELVASSERLGAKLSMQDEASGRAVAALKVLGISTKDANGEAKNMLALQEEIVLAVDKASDKAKAQGAAILLLGNEYHKIKTPIKEAAESHGEMYDYMLKTNALISTNLARNSDDYKDKTEKLGLAFKGIGNSIAEATLPGMIKFQEKMIEIATYAADVIRRFAGLTTASEETGEALGKLMTQRASALAGIAKVEGSAYAESAQGAKYLETERAKVTAINDQIREMSRLKNGADAAADAVKKAVTTGAKGEGVTVSGRTKPTKATEEADPHLDYKEIYKKQQAALDEFYKGVEELDKLQAKYAADLQKVIDVEEDKAKASDRSLSEYRIQIEVMQRFGATSRDVAKALRDNEIAETATALAIAKAKNETSNETVVLQKKLDVLRKINDNESGKDALDAKERQRTSTFEYGWESAFDTYKNSAMTAADQARAAFSSTTDHMSSALDTFVTTGKLNFRSLTLSILADLAKIALQKAIVGFVGSMFGASGGGYQMSAVGFSNAAGISGGRAGGGGVDAGKDYVVGENGPEVLRMGATSGTIIPNSAAGLGSQNIQVVVNVQGGKDAKETGDIVSSSVVQVIRGVVKQELATAGRQRAYAV